MSGMNISTNVTFFNNTASRTLISLASRNLKAGFSLTILILGFLLNTFVIVLFLVKKQSKTSFTIYQMNLLIINVVYIMTCNILDFLNALYQMWWLGRPLCYLYLYGMWSIAQASYQSHFLIAASRLWAVFQPISYRTYSTVKFGIISCCVSFVMAHIFTSPGLIYEGLYYHTALSPRSRGACLMSPFTADFTAWVGFMQIWTLICFYSSLAVYPVVWIKRNFGRKIGRKVFANSQAKSVESTALTTVTQATSDGTENTASNTTAKKAQPESKPAAVRRGQGFRVLSLLTLSLLLFWTPGALYTTLLRVSFNYFDATALTVCITIKNMQMIVDPIIFMMVIPELKEWSTGVIRKLKQKLSGS